ncbi:MAG: lysophospholipase [Bacteroidetes bacterium]|nr:lysophospholipase [Bacteroidota bacterium]
MTKKIYLLLGFFWTALAFAQTHTHQTQEVQVGSLIHGTLLTPDQVEKPPLAIIIAGSGPTDRNGNQPMIQNNSLKYLAEALTNKGVATYRFDKRILTQMKAGTLREEDLSFDDFVTDVRNIVAHFKNEFSKIYLIGHSQGSLVGMLAAQENVTGFVSISGPAQSIDQVLQKQIGQQAPFLVEEMRVNFAKLRDNKPIEQVNPNLYSIFKPSVQNFMRSWMVYNPTEEIAKLHIPVLIISGENDLQVPMADGDLLYGANQNAEWVLISGMNHVLKIVSEAYGENIQSYNKTDLPISEDLVSEIIAFIQKQS